MRTQRCRSQRDSRALWQRPYGTALKKRITSTPCKAFSSEGKIAWLSSATVM